MARFDTAKSQTTEPVAGAGEREHTEGAHALITQAPDHLGETTLGREIRDDEWLLVLPHPACDGAVGIEFQAGCPLLRTVGVDVHAHDIFRVVMQGEIDEVEFFDALQTEGEFLQHFWHTRA